MHILQNLHIIAISPTIESLNITNPLTIGKYYFLEIIGTNFVQIGQQPSSVIYEDQFITNSIVPISFTNTQIITLTPLFYDENVFYPRKMVLSVLFSNGLVVQYTNGTIQFNALPTVTIYPPSAPTKSNLTQVSLYPLPVLDLKPYQSSIFLQLYSLQFDYVIPLSCDAYGFCNLSKALPSEACNMDLKITAVNLNAINTGSTVQTHLSNSFIVFGMKLNHYYNKYRYSNNNRLLAKVILTLWKPGFYSDW